MEDFAFVVFCLRRCAYQCGRHTCRYICKKDEVLFGVRLSFSSKLPMFFMPTSLMSVSVPRSEIPGAVLDCEDFTGVMGGGEILCAWSSLVTSFCDNLT